MGLLKKLSLKKESGQYITAEKQRFIDRSSLERKVDEGMVKVLEEYGETFQILKDYDK